MATTYTALLLRTDSTWQRIQLQKNLSEFPQPRDCVGDWVDILPHFDTLIRGDNNETERLVAYCDGECLLKQLPENPFYFALLWHRHTQDKSLGLFHTIRGDIVVCGSTTDSGGETDNDSITEQEIQDLLNIVKPYKNITERQAPLMPITRPSSR